MKIIEYGKENPEVIMLLHGGGLSWWNYRDEAERLKGRYRVVLPVLDGHADSGAPFTTIEDNAAELIGYIDEHFNGSVRTIGGLSLGGQILAEMLSQRGDICGRALIESALVIPMALTAAWVGPIFGASYGLIQKEWFSQMQFKSLRIRPELFEDYYRDSCKIKKEDMIRFLQANSSYTAKPGLAGVKAVTTIVVGGREQKIMRRSAEILHETIPGSRLLTLDGYYHGELSLNHPAEYADLLTSPAPNTP